ncbi:MAG: proline racemase family protein [Anaerolineae bacterium]
MADQPGIFPGLDTAVLERFGAVGGAFKQPIVTLDSHTAGEPTRLVVGGLPSLPGETINDRRLHVARKMDFVRHLLMREPRGHRDMFGAIVTEPVSPEAAFGLIFMDTGRYPYLCGHATIGAVTTLIEAGAIEPREPETVVVIDTPSDTITARAQVRAGRVRSVAFQAEAAFVYQLDRPLDVPGLGTVSVDVVCAGGFFVMAPADDIGLALAPANAGELARLGAIITDAANEQLSVQHPALPYMNTVDVVEFYGPGERAQADGKSVVILGDAQVDRSPCVTGTCAKMALLHHRGELAVGKSYVNEGVLGTVFEGRVVAETRVGDLPAIVPEVRGSAHVTGVHYFLLDPEDPFPNGFLLGAPADER